MKNLKLKPYILRKRHPEIGDYIAQADINDSQGRLIASVIIRKHTIGRVVQLTRVFAAAPDLYEALRNTICYHCDERIGDEWPKDTNECHICKDARLAIARVRGEAL